MYSSTVFFWIHCVYFISILEAVRNSPNRACNRAVNGVERAENWVSESESESESESGAVCGCGRKRLSRSRARKSEVAEWERSGERWSQK